MTAETKYHRISQFAAKIIKIIISKSKFIIIIFSVYSKSEYKNFIFKCRISAECTALIF